MTSAVAGVLDRNGGLRVVVTQRWRMHHHVNKGERLFVVPGMLVEEPVPWDDIPKVIAKVQDHVNKIAAPHNKCGGCFACCDVPRIDAPELFKPSHRPCDNCTGSGCKIYVSRPRLCREFECFWLKSQSRNDRMPAELRPDRCGVIFNVDTQGGDPLVFEVIADKRRPGVTDAPAVRGYIDDMQRAGFKAKLVTHFVGEAT